MNPQVAARVRLLPVSTVCVQGSVIHLSNQRSPKANLCGSPEAECLQLLANSHLTIPVQGPPTSEEDGK